MYYFNDKIWRERYKTDHDLTHFEYNISLQHESAFNSIVIMDSVEIVSIIKVSEITVKTLLFVNNSNFDQHGWIIGNIDEIRSITQLQDTLLGQNFLFSYHFVLKCLLTHI